MESIIGIVEIGSTNTKAYRCEKEKIIELGFKTIEFKKNYNVNGRILYSDIDKLVQYIRELFSANTYIYVCATSIFRELGSIELEEFERNLQREFSGISFEVVSAKEENELTAIGAIDNVNIEGNICVFIGGGGSTEISICNNGIIKEMANSNFGVSHIMKKFPELADDYTDLEIDKVTNYIVERLQLPSQKADYLILAGGDFLLRYKNAKYPVEANELFLSANHPFVISYEDNRKYEQKYYQEISLSDLRETTPDNPDWWNGTRAMCAFTNAVALGVDAKIIIPTRISMVYGIAAKKIKNLL
jgi:hypothetical protein